MKRRVELSIIGAGGHACVIAEAAEEVGFAVKGYFADTASEHSVLGKWLGNDSVLVQMNDDMKLALGFGFVSAEGAKARKLAIDRLSHLEIETLIHPKSMLSGSADIGKGAFLPAGSIISSFATIDKYSIVNSGAIVDHHCQIGENSHIATGARICGGVVVGRDVLVGAGSVIKQGVSVGDGAVIGAGTTVLGDIGPSEIFLGK